MSHHTPSTTHPPLHLPDQLSNPLIRTLLVTGLGGIIAGFFIGRAFSGAGGVGVSLGRKKRRRRGGRSLEGDSVGPTRKDSDEDEDEDEDEDSDSDDTSGVSEAELNFDWSEECKLVLVVRTDLGMTKGKIAAQCSHATLACYKALQKARAANSGSFSLIPLPLSDSSSTSSHRILQKWERHGQAKVVVQVRSEEELEMLQARAMSVGLVARIVHDAGRTQIASGSATVLGVGPGPKTVVDGVTGDLKLL